MVRKVTSDRIAPNHPKIRSQTFVDLLFMVEETTEVSEEIVHVVTPVDMVHKLSRVRLSKTQQIEVQTHKRIEEITNKVFEDEV